MLHSVVLDDISFVFEKTDLLCPFVPSRSSAVAKMLHDRRTSDTLCSPYATQIDSTVALPAKPRHRNRKQLTSPDTTIIIPYVSIVLIILSAFVNVISFRSRLISS